MRRKQTLTLDQGFACIVNKRATAMRILLTLEPNLGQIDTRLAFVRRVVTYPE